ncbi:hypothetical protein PSTT_06811 [Puccinia striiformis]|uniref:Uncharacterized protein n=1 Tax=Puccinia striiformis TaxID=27350 RepID=A0A2S4VIZ7_9BASI|nr:hypothetical protein PSTT_06811 [Puccinia striiformis]
MGIVKSPQRPSLTTPWPSRCHFCKKNCGSLPGRCPNQIDKKWVDIPTSFVTPPKPADYRRPRALDAPPNPAGRPTQPPAGRPPHRAATVAAVDELPIPAAANEEFESFPPPTFEDAELSVINAREIDTVDAVQLNEDDRLAPEFCTGDLAHNLDWREMAAIQEDMYVSPTPSCPPSPSRSTGLPLRGRFTACRTAPSISVGIRLPTHQHRFQPQPTSLPATTTSSNFAATAI